MDSGTAARHLGPFTGRQLTTIVCVVLGALLLPIGAWATTSLTHVVITGPTGTNQARVSASGALSASVTGNVIATNAPPTKLAAGVADTQGSFMPIVPAANGSALTNGWVVNTVAIDVTAFVSGSHPLIMFGLYKDQACTVSGYGGSRFNFHPQGVGLTTVPFPSGIYLPSDAFLCVKTSDATTAAEVWAYGYGL